MLYYICIIIFWQDFIQTLTSWYAWDWNRGTETQTSKNVPRTCYFIRWNLSSVLCKNTFSTTNACCQPVKYNCRTNCQSQLIHIHQSKGSHPLKNSRIWEQCFQRIPSVSNLRLPKLGILLSINWWSPFNVQCSPVFRSKCIVHCSNPADMYFKCYFL